jgi:acyl-CoA thioester hydrolase
MTNLIWDHDNPFIAKLVPTELDMDGLGHTNNGVYLRWCEAIAWAHSASLGIDLSRYQADDRAMAIRHAKYDYIAASVVGDELLLGTWIVNGNSRIKMQRHFQLVDSHSGQAIFRGFWHLACIEISSGRPKKMPPFYVQTYGAVAINVGC